MPYIFKQKLQIQELVDLQQPIKRILIHEPEEYLAALYQHYLQVHNFDIKHCPVLESLEVSAKNFAPDVLIFNIGENHNSKAEWLLKFKKDFPEAGVITTGFNTNSEILKLLLSAGISSHINRKLTRPQDIAVVVKSMLQN